MSNGGSIASAQSLWGEDADNVIATQALSGFTQFPACGYDIEFTAYIENLDGSLAPLPIPNQVTFEQSLDDFYFTFQKCSPATYEFDPECGDVDPYEIVYNIVVLATVPQNPEDIVNDDIKFSYEIGNTCEMDTLAIAPKGAIPYMLKNPPNLYSDSITITQTYSFCPYVCNLFKIDAGQLVQYPIEIFNTWNYNNGDFTILTGDKSLDGTFMFMQVQCISTLSLTQQTPVASNFAVSFMDECKYSIVVPPNPEDQFIKLFFEKSFTFDAAVVKNSAGEIINCGEPTTTLIGIEEQYPDITIDYENRIVTVLGTDPVKHVDAFPLVFESCIELANGQQRCRRPSNVFKLVVTNPCTTSNIVTQPIPSILSAPILGQDVLSMSAAPTNWPWTEYITMNGVQYFDYCQPINL